MTCGQVRWWNAWVQWTAYLKSLCFSGKLLHRYKGCTGAVTDIAVPSTECPSFLASTSIDRFLRVHQLAGNRALQHRVYLKQRMTCLLIDNGKLLSAACV